MRRYGLAVTLFAALGFVATGAWADVPDPAHCVVDSILISACPYNHPPGTSDLAAHSDTATIVLYTSDDNPVEGYPCSQLGFTVVQHPNYPGTQDGAPCPDCEDWYTITCLTDSSDAFGVILIDIAIGPTCAPSVCCPVFVWVDIQGVKAQIPYPIQVLQNTYDLVANGHVAGPDFGSFSTAYGLWTQTSVRSPCADFVYSEVQTDWGEVMGPDFGSFSTHYKDCCGMIKTDNPEIDCDPWQDPCP